MFSRVSITRFHMYNRVARFIYHRDGEHVNLHGTIMVLLVLQVVSTGKYKGHRYLHMVYLPRRVLERGTSTEREEDDDNDTNSASKIEAPSSASDGTDSLLEIASLSLSTANPIKKQT